MNDLLDGFGDFGTSIADAMNDVAGIGQNVSSFFKNVFNWMPTPILSMILLSITLTVGLSVLRFLNKLIWKHCLLFFDGIWAFMGTKINIYGITMSFRDIYLWSILVGISASFCWRINT